MRENLIKELKMLEKMLLTATRTEANMLDARKVQIEHELSRLDRPRAAA